MRYRYRFPGQGGLIYHRQSTCYNSVDGNDFAGSHKNIVTNDDLVDGYVFKR